VQVHVYADARRPIAAEAQNLALRRRIIRIQTLTHQHLFSIQSPAFREYAVALLAADFILNMIGN